MSQIPAKTAAQTNAPASETARAQNKAQGHVDEARQQVELGKQQASRTAEQLKQQGKQVAQESKAQLQHAAADVQSAARDTADQARAQTLEMLERQKLNAAQGVASFQHAIESASHKLREEDNPQVAHYAEVAAQELQRVSKYLEQRSVGALWSDMDNFARKRPEVVCGGLFVAGLAAARFLKASSRRHHVEATPPSAVPATSQPYHV